MLSNAPLRIFLACHWLFFKLIHWFDFFLKFGTPDSIKFLICYPWIKLAPWIKSWSLRAIDSVARWYPLGVDANLIMLPFKPNAPWTTHQRRKTRNKNRKDLSRRQQTSNWGRGLHPRHAPWLIPFESQQRLTQLTQHATHESKTKYTSLYAKRHSAQPDMFWRTHHTKSNPKSMRVMPLCLWGV